MKIIDTERATLIYWEVWGKKWTTYMCDSIYSISWIYKSLCFPPKTHRAKSLEKEEKDGDGEGERQREEGERHREKGEDKLEKESEREILERGTHGKVNQQSPLSECMWRAQLINEW